MSELITNYSGRGSAATLEAFKNRFSSLGIQHEQYVQPTSEEVRSLRKIMGLTQNELAALTGVFFDKKNGSSTVRKWEANTSEKSCITPSAWELMLLKSGLLTIEVIDTTKLSLFNR